MSTEQGAQDWAIERRLPDPVLAYARQVSAAKNRGIQFLLGFSEWWEIWKPYYHLRGPGKNGLVMGRHGDVGPYALGNVYLTTRLGNTRDYHASEKAVADRLKYAERRGLKRSNRRASGQSYTHLDRHMSDGLVMAVWQHAAPKNS